MQRKLMGVAAALLVLAGTAAAQTQVEERRPAAPDVVVEIDNPVGSTRVVAWDRAEIQVTGTLGEGAGGVSIEGNKRRAEITVETAGDPHKAPCDLEIKVPAGSRLEIDSFTAAIEVTGVKGDIRAETVQGSIVISDATGDVDAESVNGSVQISGSSQRVQAESVNGTVTVTGAGGEVKASTVNGRLAVSGGTFDRVGLETVNGQVVFEGELRPQASLDVESVGGSVELRLPARTSAELTVATFSGTVRNDFGAGARPVSKWTSEQELSFTLGSGSAKVSVETLSGDVEIRKR